jgi:hypothetical protein
MTISRRSLLAKSASIAAISPLFLNRTAGALMIEPTSPAEQLMYCTARIVGQIVGSTGFKSGTGFFYNYPTEDDKQVPVLITNKHVIENTSALQFVVHTASVKDAKKPDGNGTIGSSQADWIPHPNPKVDLCAVPVGPVMNKMTPIPFFRALDPSLVKSQKELEELNAVEDVLMVGYPNGLWDATNNFPLLRRGITASHPAVDFDVDGVATTVVDVASFPGSSGSPVFIYNNGTIPNKNGATGIGTRVILLGILYSGPTFQPDGSIVVKNIPTVNVAVPQINMMMNLGYVLKAAELAALGSAIFSKLNLKAPAIPSLTVAPPK